MQSGHRPAVAGQGQHPRKREGERSRQTACNPGKIRSSTRPPASAKGAVPTDRTRVRSSSKPCRDGKREGGRFLQSVAERDRRSSPAAGIRGRQRMQSAAEEPTANGRHRRGGAMSEGPALDNPRRTQRCRNFRRRRKTIDRFVRPSAILPRPMIARTKKQLQESEPFRRTERRPGSGKAGNGRKKHSTVY